MFVQLLEPSAGMQYQTPRAYAQSVVPRDVNDLPIALQNGTSRWRLSKSALRQRSRFVYFSGEAMCSLGGASIKPRKKLGFG